MPQSIIETAHLFAPLHAELMTLLRSLDHAQWHAPTVAGEWRVRDVAAHLVQVCLQRLSADRDKYTVSSLKPVSYDDVLALINASNRNAVAAMQRYSPRVLIDLLQRSGDELASHFESLDPFAPALYPVAWAGEESSLNWMDIGREYTEQWHHQQQIRDAAGAPLLLEANWTKALFALSVRALPRSFAAVDAPDGTSVVIRIPPVGAWTLVREGSAWQLQDAAAPSPVTDITISPDDAWRIFYNALPADAALPRLDVRGDARFAEAFARTRSVMV